MSQGVENEALEPNPYQAASESDAQTEYEHYHSYKAVNALAVVSLGLGLLSGLIFLHWQFGIVAILGIVFGGASIWQIKQRPHELAGLPIAYTGVILSAVLLPAGIGWLTYVYHTEMPEGFTRIHYDLFRPTEEDRQFPPEAALAWNGKEVFIKGYMYPSNKSVGLKEFTLCRDNKDCCFGGTPQPYDMIRVKMVHPPKADHSSWQRKLAGTLKVLTPEEIREKGLAVYREGGESHQVFFILYATYIK